MDKGTPTTTEMLELIGLARESVELEALLERAADGKLSRREGIMALVRLVDHSDKAYGLGAIDHDTLMETLDYCNERADQLMGLPDGTTASITKNSDTAEDTKRACAELMAEGDGRIDRLVKRKSKPELMRDPATTQKQIKEAKRVLRVAVRRGSFPCVHMFCSVPDQTSEVPRGRVAVDVSVLLVTHPTGMSSPTVTNITHLTARAAGASHVEGAERQTAARIHVARERGKAADAYTIEAAEFMWEGTGLNAALNKEDGTGELLLPQVTMFVVE